tara:strand:- start:156 stop:290 length:135 start_codon:yes stop_codon:yes gene_type:complete
MSKGSDRRTENEPKVRDRLAKVDWSKREKSKDTFSVKINGIKVK